jgi:hypothetical protein
MAATHEYKTTPSDLAVLREVAQRKMEIANDPVNLQRRESWLELHSSSVGRPMVLAEWGGIMDQAKPFEPELACIEEWAQGVERELRQQIWVFERLKDDHVVEPVFDVRWNVEASNYGVEPVMHKVEGDHLTARRWDAPIENIDRDFHKLHPRTYSVDRDQTHAWKAHLEDVFEGVMPVRIRGSFWWTMGMTIQAIHLIGLEQLMLYMYDDPDGLHRIMQFLHDDHVAYAEWLEREGLLTLNNENDYCGSGSIGYVRDLPQPDYTDGAPARMIDQWVLLESQETVGVGPVQFEEFVFPYQKSIADRFGLVYYGCCEPVHTRWDVLTKFNNVRGVSIAPMCDQAICAEALGADYVFSRKPNPALISTEHFNEDLIRQDLRETLTLTKPHNCRVELIMKDVHTLANEPPRLARWVELAREEIAANW